MSIPDFDRMAPELGRLAHGFAREHNVPGLAAGLVFDGTLVWRQGIGYADGEARRPVNGLTMFRIASITKTFTATLVFQLRDAGRLRLDDAVVSHVPELAAARNPFGNTERVTIRQLLTHTSGLATQPEITEGLPGYPWQEEAIAAVLAAPGMLRFLDAPGSAFRYSNMGYGLLGAAIERLTGQTFARALANAITRPLAMAATVHDPMGALADRCATGYIVDRGKREPATIIDSAWLPASGGLWSNVEDLARWIGAQLVAYGSSGHGVLDAVSTIEMHRQVVVAEVGSSRTWGHGWHGVREGDLVLLGHGGSLPGFTSHIALAPWKRIGVIVLANTACDTGRLATAMAGAALEFLRRAPTGASGARRPTSPVRTPAAWRRLVGTYRGPGSAGRITVRDGGLTYVPEPTSVWAPVRRLESTEDAWRFILRDREGRHAGSLLFVRGIDGQIDRLTLDGFPMTRVADT